MKDYIRKIVKQETYLGEKKKNNYFEGWYFKLTTHDKKNTLVLIPGIAKGKDAHAFIQVIDTVQNKAYYFRYELKDFSFSNDPFFINIGNNKFSLEKIILDIKDIHLYGEIHFKPLLKIHKNVYSPNIMGPFAYLTFMECNHSVISLGHYLSGKINIYNKKINFSNGTGYIEKDYGISFPKKYIWLQANGNKPDTNIFLSIATIPFKSFTFDGFIGIIMLNGKEYRFATYNRSKLVEMKQLEENNYFIKIRKGSLYLEINMQSGKEITLISPKKGRMNEHVKESLNSVINVKLLKKDKVLFEEIFDPCTTEVFW